MRTIKFIVVHCTATQPDATVESIKNYWQTYLGWKNPGYHYLILRTGEVVNLQKETLPSNGVKGHNMECIHLAYIGGVDKDNQPMDNRTGRQKQAMFDLIIELSNRYLRAQILGHRDFEGVKKACPCFDVQEWIKTYEPDLRNAA